MSASAFPLQGALDYRRKVHSETCKEALRAAEELRYVEAQLSELERRRSQSAKLLASGGRNRTQQKRLRDLVSDLWMQMLSLRPLARKHKERLEEIEALSYRTGRDVDALERVREHTSRRKRISSARRGVAGRIGIADRKRVAHVD